MCFLKTSTFSYISTVQFSKSGNYHWYNVVIYGGDSDFANCSNNILFSRRKFEIMNFTLLYPFSLFHMDSFCFLSLSFKTLTFSLIYISQLLCRMFFNLSLRVQVIHFGKNTVEMMLCSFHWNRSECIWGLSHYWALTLIMWLRLCLLGLPL